MSVHWVPKAGNRWWRVNTPGLEAFEGFLLTTCFWEQGLLFHDKTPFRVSPKLCYGLGGGNCILCLNALMFIWNGYVQISLMLYSLKIIKLHNWIINFVSPLEAVPECPFQSAVFQALQLTPNLGSKQQTDFEKGSHSSRSEVSRMGHQSSKIPFVHLMHHFLKQYGVNLPEEQLTSCYQTVVEYIHGFRRKEPWIYKLGQE